MKKKSIALKNRQIFSMQEPRSQDDEDLAEKNRPTLKINGKISTQLLDDNSIIAQDQHNFEALETESAVNSIPQEIFLPHVNKKNDNLEDAITQRARKF